MPYSSTQTAVEALRLQESAKIEARQSGLIVAAAMAAAAGIPERIAVSGLTEQQANEALSKKYRSWGWRDLISASLRAHDREAGWIGDGEIADAMRIPITAGSGGGFATLSLESVSANLCNKAVVAGYTTTASVVDCLCYETDVKDLKPFWRYRLTGDGAWSEVGPAGEVSAQGKDALAALLDETYSGGALRTRAQAIRVTRQDYYNDDTGAFVAAGMVMGRSAKLAREEAVVKLALASIGTHFSAANGNYISGADSALGAAGLGKAAQKMAEQKDRNGRPVNLLSRWLVVPPAMETVAKTLYRDLTVPGSEEEQANRTSRHEPAMSPYMSEAFGLPGASDTGYFLVANSAAGYAPLMVGYLAGSNRQPQIQMARRDIMALAIDFVGIWDFGIGLADHRCGVYAAGK